ncbi:hypothetical protein HQO84_01505 [Rhodococcus fascians]|nr:hypothetical protein [Rhodococcus fascians]MBY3995232.1 hypothetical protein [Rhodococcus fascians]MBY4000448.1 hypothetical protein [Rhodococcus fascians]MBY4005476.1 hypothetical protein [Rhodococcus fascians]MBY4016309.1 hypothetical protein [Rhodococcus fascians]
MASTDDLMSADCGIPTELRPQIAQSWHRSHLSGLDRSHALMPQRDPDMDISSRLLRAATPVLERARGALDGVRAGGLLTDGTGIVVGRYFGNRQFEAVCTRLGGSLGMHFDEPHTGTNAIATALETRAPVVVLSEEHYLECLHPFDCYGVPIFNPVTRRLEGAIDMVVFAGSTEFWPALRLLLDQLVRDIETRLMSDYDYELQKSVAAFQALCQRTQDAAILFGDDFLLQNRRAQSDFSPTDLELLKQVANTVNREQTVAVTLESGRDVTVQYARADSPRRHTLLRVRSDARSRLVVPRAPGEAATVTERIDRKIVELSHAVAHTGIIGERGTGRTYAARSVAGPGALLLDGATMTRGDLTRVSSHRGTVVVDDMDDANPDILASFASTVSTSLVTRFVVVSTPARTDSADYVLSLCPERLDLPPLRARLADVPSLADRMLTSSDSPDGRGLRLSRAVHDLLQHHVWPGNLAELRAVIDDVVGRRSVGDISIADLPQRYQRPSTPRRGLTALEQAEWSVIQETLTRFDWNKSHAAKELGISRSKLYARMRYFAIA